jgi:membrane-associated phospholipid phosphatase
VTRRHLIAALAVFAYAAAIAKVVELFGGVPASRDVLVPVLLGGFLALSITSRRRLRRLALGLAIDWLPFVLALWLYDLIRGYADGAWLPVHVRPQIDLDRLLAHGSVPTVWLQQHLWSESGPRWWDYATWFTYMSHFYATTLVLAVLWWRSRRLFQRLAAMVVLLAFAGCATYVLFPAAPPWLAAEDGVLPPVARTVGETNRHIPLLSFDSLWERGTAYANDVAAIPSLHGAYAFLLALFLVARIRSPLKHLLWLYPLAMAFVLVYSGEHYLTDILLGWLYVVAAYAVVSRLMRGRAGALPVRAPATDVAVPAGDAAGPRPGWRASS